MKIKNKINGVVKIAILFAIVGLSACAKSPKTVDYVTPQKPSINEIRANMIDGLEEYGDVQVIREGENVRIVLRSDYVFSPNSANLRQPYKAVLKKVAKLLSTYSKINVKVAAYSDNQGKVDFLEGLTTRQAQVVANFLWNHGIDTRLLYAVGYNKLNSVDSNNSLSGQSYNRRVEVSFRYIPN